MLATRISFMNELANLAEAIGADIEDVRRGIGSDPRIGYQFLYPGAGFGGSCFPEGREGAAAHRTEAGRPLRVIRRGGGQRGAEARARGQDQPQFGDRPQRQVLRALGLAFKANTDDMREALEPHADRRPARRRRARCAPTIPPRARGASGSTAEASRSTIVDSAIAALEGADALVVVTEWQEFRSPDFAAIKAS
jgi:UDPglucose 6-dehydrogenase